MDWGDEIMSLVTNTCNISLCKGMRVMKDKSHAFSTSSHSVPEIIFS